MANPEIHPLAPHHIPGYVVQADGSDYLFTVMVIFTIVLILLIGLAYFTLHAMPEKLAHDSNHSQFQLVGILALLALFTHNNIFWIAAVLLAGLQLPDLAAPLKSIADAIRSLTPRRQDTPEPEPAGQGAAKPASEDH